MPTEDEPVDRNCYRFEWDGPVTGAADRGSKWDTSNNTGAKIPRECLQIIFYVYQRSLKMSRSSLLLFVFVWLSIGETVRAQQDTILMSVLSSQRHQWGKTDVPVIGIFRSADDGISWEHIGWRGYIRTFYTESGPDGTIWAACGNGVLRSTDSGNSFVITSGWEMTEVLKVRVNPLDPRSVYAATAYGVFRTSDYGSAWIELNSGLPDLPFVSDLLLGIPDTHNILAATENGAYASYDGGKRWNQSGLEGIGIRVLARHPREYETIWAGTEDDGIFISTDNGRTWKQRNEGLVHPTVYAIALDPMNTNVVYLGTHGGGVYKSIDGGNTWRQSIHGLKNLDIHALAVISSNTDIVLAGTLNGGLYRSTDGGMSWIFNTQDGGQVWGLSVH